MEIKLKRKRDKCEFVLKIDHALSLLRRNNKDWEIADKKYQFKDNEIIKRSSNRETQKPESK